MQESSTTVTTILQFRQEVERQLHDQIRQAVEVVLDEELAAAPKTRRSRCSLALSPSDRSSCDESTAISSCRRSSPRSGRTLREHAG